MPDVHCNDTPEVERAADEGDAQTRLYDPSFFLSLAHRRACTELPSRALHVWFLRLRWGAKPLGARGAKKPQTAPATRVSISCGRNTRSHCAVIPTQRSFHHPHPPQRPASQPQRLGLGVPSRRWVVALLLCCGTKSYTCKDNFCCALPCRTWKKSSAVNWAWSPFVWFGLSFHSCGLSVFFPVRLDVGIPIHPWRSGVALPFLGRLTSETMKSLHGERMHH